MRSSVHAALCGTVPLGDACRPGGAAARPLGLMGELMLHCRSCRALWGGRGCRTGGCPQCLSAGCLFPDMCSSAPLRCRHAMHPSVHEGTAAATPSLA